MNRKNIAALACWIAAFVSLAVILRAGHPLQAHLVHSDALYLPVLFADLVSNGGRLGDWLLTPAPYFFPDMPLYGLAWLAGGGVAGQTIAFALLQTALATCALYLLARQALPGDRLPVATALSILFIWLGLHADDPFVRLFASAHHYGAFIASLLLCTAWLRRDAGPERRPACYGVAVLVALTFLTTLSDALFLAQTVLPLLASAWLFRRDAAPATKPRRALLLLLGPALAGMFAYPYVVAHPTRYPNRLGLSQLADHLIEMGNIAATLFGGRPLLAVAIALALALGAACLLAGLRGRALPGLPRALQLLAAFATLSFLATIGAMLLSKHMQPVPRYLISALSWPLIAGLFALANLLDARRRHAGAALPLALSLALTVSLVSEAWPLRSVDDTERHYYPEQVACIDQALAQAGARHGMAQYWDAKRLQALSRQRLTLAQYTGELEPMKWITSERFYGPRYDFAIVAEQEPAAFKLSRARLVALGGEPLKTVACGDRTVLLYSPGGLPAPTPASR